MGRILNARKLCFLVISLDISLVIKLGIEDHPDTELECWLSSICVANSYADRKGEWRSVRHHIDPSDREISMLCPHAGSEEAVFALSSLLLETLEEHKPTKSF